MSVLKVLFPADGHVSVGGLVVAEIRDLLVAGLPEGEGRFRLAKRVISRMAACEGLYVAEDEAGWPGWSVPVARGTLVHEAATTWLLADRLISPVAAVDAVLAERLARQDGLAWWLADLGMVERTELRREVNNAVNLFVRDLAPLRDIADVRADSRVEACVGECRLRLVNAPDVAVGWAGWRVSIELKSGPVRGDHLADAMFGALVEALRFGRAPDRVVLWSLASGEGVGYDVRADDLRAAARRVLATVGKIDALATRPPRLTPGGQCRFCPASASCPEASTVLDISRG